MGTTRQFLAILRLHGWSWLASRLLLEAQKQSGWEARKYPARVWRGDEWRAWLRPDLCALSPTELLERWRSGPGAAWGRARREPRWRDAHKHVLDEGGRGKLPAAADEILAGRFQLFSRHVVNAGFPPNWQCNLALGAQAVPPPDVHWSKVPMRGETFGDLKYVWELSRFTWAFPLARAYAATGDEKYAEGFWRLWADWIGRNPPNMTVQWKCGQECSLRLMAVSFAVQVFAPAAATTPERFARHLGAAGALADRVARAGWYAHLQNNNHSMSEAAGLYTVGVFFPELESAAAWRAQGWRELGGEALRLIREDGTFTQKSHNYHRLMLQDYAWAQSVADSAGDTWPAPVAARLRRAADYLRAVVDARSGEAPNFGANDGALVLPLSDVSYTDFRPALAAAQFAAHGHRLPGLGGAGDEDVLWLFGADALSAPTAPATPPPELIAETGGIYTLRQDSDEAWIFMHAEDFRDRAGQADQLHVDLWWRGLNIARDPGSFMYYGEPRLFDRFRGTAMHNTVAVDDCDQMERGPRFLWVNWARANIIERCAASGAKGAGIVAEHDGYARLPGRVIHRRGVLALGKARWLVWDEITGAGAHSVRLHWLLGDWPARETAPGALTLDTPQGEYRVAVRCPAPADFQTRRAVSSPELWGWESRHYGERTPALSLTAAANAPLPVRFITIFSPDEFSWAGESAQFPSGARWGDGALSWPANDSPWRLDNIVWTPAA